MVQHASLYWQARRGVVKAAPMPKRVRPFAGVLGETSDEDAGFIASRWRIREPPDGFLGCRRFSLPGPVNSPASPKSSTPQSVGSATGT